MFHETIRNARKPLFHDLAEVAPDAEYVACFGKSKGLARLAALSKLKSLWISGLNPAQFKQLAACKAETLVIHDLRVADLEALQALPNLRRLVIIGNTKLTTLDSIRPLAQLETLALEHFPKVRDLAPLRHLSALKELALEGSVETAMRVETLEPLGDLVGLHGLQLLNLKVDDRRLAPLAALIELQELNLANMYPTAEVAHLARALPHTKCGSFAAHRPTNIACKRCGRPNLMVIQERLALACPHCDAQLCERQRADWDRLLTEKG